MWEWVRVAAEIHRDSWGIPHVRAGSVGEVARAQGLVTARDRAWQLEVERHRAQGTSASFLGIGALPWDRFARRARLADTARRCFAALERDDPETADWVRAYVTGVNEGLATAASEEFTRVGLTPGRWEPWTPLGVWIAAHILFAGFPAKLWRERVTRVLGADAVRLFAADGPGTSGSNGWLAGGERTTTGHAVIAGDPHRFIEDPGVYQQIRLSCPEFDVVGLAVPGVPGIAHFGHTGTVAWAITNAMADYQDLYRERLRRTADGVEALGPDGVWRRVHRHTEVIEVAGGTAGEETGDGAGEAAGEATGRGTPAGGRAVGIEVLETERGPVIIGGPEDLREDIPGDARADLREGAADHSSGPLAVSLRHPPRVTSDLGFGALLPLLRARRVADVDRAVERWAEPVNVVQAADTEGGVLHRVAGRVPVRHADNRTRLVPAWEPGYEWRGWHDMPRDGLTDGVAVMANQRGPSAPLGVEFAPPHRAERITALLAGRERWSAADMTSIHTDTYLASAAPLLDHLAGLAASGLTPGAAALRDRLLRWDRRMDADSAVAAEFAAVRGAVVRLLAAEPAFAALVEPPAHPEVFRPWLALTPRIGYALEHLLRARELYGVDRPAAVRAALEEVAAAGTAGTWGDSHRLAPWRALAPPEPHDGPRLSGDHDCVLCTSAVPGLTDLAARGPAARYVWDLARREDSLWVVPFGASGVPGSAHHHDQLPLWLKGEFVPVVTDWNQLEKETDA